MNLLEERQSKQNHLAELNLFLAGRVYTGWEASRKEMLRLVELDLIENPLRNREDEINQLKDKGKRELLLDLASQFQDARETLISRLDEIEELLTPNTEKQETNDTE